MRDSYDRTIQYLRLSVTDRCNYRCRYCMPEDGVCKKRHEEMLSQEEMLDAMAAEYGESVQEEPPDQKKASRGKGKAEPKGAPRTPSQSSLFDF